MTLKIDWTMVKKRKAKRLVVNFDKEARKEYLLGFSQRKQERRQRAIEQLKEQAKNERKQALREVYGETPQEPKKRSEEAEEALKELSNTTKVKTITEKISDNFTKGNFGVDEVIVTTTTLDDDADDSDSKVEVKGFKRREKNIKIGMGRAGKMLNQMKRSKDRKRSRFRRKTDTKVEKKKPRRQKK